MEAYEEAFEEAEKAKSGLMKSSDEELEGLLMFDKRRMGFLRHRKSIKSSRRILWRARLSLFTPSLIDLMSFDWLFLGGLLPSRAHLCFTSYEDCAVLMTTDQNETENSKTVHQDFYVRQRFVFHQDFYVRQYVLRVVTQR